MKCLKSVAVCLALLCLLTGCTPGTEGTPAVTTQPAATEDTASKTVLYKNSVRQFLMPVQEHSWERKHRPECVMLHFTSAVMWSKENPFDMENISRILKNNLFCFRHIFSVALGHVLVLQPFVGAFFDGDCVKISLKQGDIVIFFAGKQLLCVLFAEWDNHAAV